MWKIINYAQIPIGFRWFLTAMAIHFSIWVAQIINWKYGMLVSPLYSSHLLFIRVHRVPESFLSNRFLFQSVGSPVIQRCIFPFWPDVVSLVISYRFFRENRKYLEEVNNFTLIPFYWKVIPLFVPPKEIAKIRSWKSLPAWAKVLTCPSWVRTQLFRMIILVSRSDTFCSRKS